MMKGPRRGRRMRSYEKSESGALQGKIDWNQRRALHPRDTLHPIPDFFGEIRVSTRYPKEPEIP
jgi:hypothetical protein